MENTITPSKTTTAGQIDKAVGNYRALLEKHRGEFESEPFQLVLGQSELADEQFGVLRKRIEAISGMIVRRVSVNRNRTPKQALDATGRKQYTDGDVVNAMPHGEGDEVEVVFFKPDLTNRNGYISDADLDKDYELRGLKPADPYSVSVVNEADNAFADEKPHGTHWKDSNGKWCFATFGLWRGERFVSVDRHDYGWFDDWWFAGVRK